MQDQSLFETLSLLFQTDNKNLSFIKSICVQQFSIMMNLIWQNSVQLLIKIQLFGMLDLNPQYTNAQRSYHSETLISDFQPLDLQYEICSKFMKKASEQIYHKELELISSTSKFFQFIQDSLAQKDISTTQESLTFESCFDEDESFSQPTKSRLLLRKSKSNVSIRRTQSGLNQALREVQKCCSQKTSSLVSSMAGEFRRIKERLSSLQKNQKEFKKLEQRFNTTQEELFIAKKRVSDLQKENEIHQQELKGLKRKLKDLKEEGKSNTLALSRSSDNLKLLATNSAMDKMKRFLDEKQVNIFKKQKDLKSIQDKIQHSLKEVSGDGNCQKCCLMLKKIRQSIMKYRSLLQEEAVAAETLYNNYKRQFC